MKDPPPKYHHANARGQGYTEGSTTTTTTPRNPAIGWPLNANSPSSQSQFLIGFLWHSRDTRSAYLSSLHDKAWKLYSSFSRRRHPCCRF